MDTKPFPSFFINIIFLCVFQLYFYLVVKCIITISTRTHRKKVKQTNKQTNKQKNLKISNVGSFFSHTQTKKKKKKKKTPCMSILFSFLFNESMRVIIKHNINIWFNIILQHMCFYHKIYEILRAKDKVMNSDQIGNSSTDLL